MTRKELSEQYAEYLKNKGYEVEITDEGHVHFKKDGNYLILIDEKDPIFFQLAYPSFHKTKDEADRTKVLAACSKATASIKAAKVFMLGDNVWAAVEIFLPTPDAFKDVFDRCLTSVLSVVHEFDKAYGGHATLENK